MDTRQKSGGLWKDERGFTLPEVLVTIVIMGIVFAIASSTWFNVVESRAVDSATNQLASDLRLAHTRAANQLTDWAVVSDSTTVAASLVCGAGDYYLVRIPSSGTPTCFARGFEEDRVRVDPSTPIGARFKPNGTVNAADNSALGGPITVTVSADDGNPSHDIEVVTKTSRVEIDPPTP